MEQKFNPKELWLRAIEEIEKEELAKSNGIYNDFGGAGWIGEPVATKIVEDMKLCHRALQKGGKLISITTESGEVFKP